MGLQQKGMHGTWASRWTFIMAATGSAVGLGNMWKFPYVAGSNGGGAFVLAYIALHLINRCSGDDGGSGYWSSWPSEPDQFHARCGR